MKRYFSFLLTLIFLFSLAGCGGTDSSSDSTSSYISIVQNGYLGEFDDITVKDLLSGHYSMFYEEETWDGGTTDDGKEIVEVKFQGSTFDDGTEDATIQFTMLDEQCFKVNAFVDPMETIEQSSDLLAVLNNIYVEQYAVQNEQIVGDSAAELAFIQRLGEISGSAVLYGAASDYRGERGTICELENDSPLELSVPELLDSYGLLNLSYYTEGADDSEEDFATESDSPGTPNAQDVDLEENMKSVTYAPYDVDTLIFDLDNNALRAERTYLNQYVELTGVLYSVDNSGESFQVEQLDDEGGIETRGILCYIQSEDQVNQIIECNVGDQLTVRGKVTGMDEYSGYTLELDSFSRDSSADGGEHDDTEDFSTVTLDDFVGDYTYGGGTPYEDTSTWFHIEPSLNKPGLVLYGNWMGEPEFDNVFIDADCLEGTALVFQHAPIGSTFLEEYTFTFVSAEETEFGRDLIFTGYDEVPYVKDPGM